MDLSIFSFVCLLLSSGSVVNSSDNTSEISVSVNIVTQTADNNITTVASTAANVSNGIQVTQATKNSTQGQTIHNSIDEELDKLENSGYLLFPHIYRAFILAGKNPDSLNISSTCGKNLAKYYRGLHTRKAWAWSMYDSTGKQRAGVFTGALTWAGNYQQCLDALGYRNDVKEFIKGKEVDAQYCSVYISTPSWVTELVDSMGLPFPPPHPPFIADVCTVVGCSEQDIWNIVQAFVNEETWFGNYTVQLVKCQVNLSIQNNAGAVITLCIVSLILLLVLTGTTYELYLRARRHGVKISRDILIGVVSTDIEVLCKPSAKDEVIEPVSKGQNNAAFIPDEPEVNHHPGGKRVSLVTSEQETSLNESSTITDVHHVIISEADTTHILNSSEHNGHSGNIHHNETEHKGEATSGVRRASRRLSELMFKSAAKIQRSFKKKTSRSEFPQMQKRHLKTQLSMSESEVANRSTVHLLERCLVCFSLRRNFTNLLGKGHLDTMFCINGVRVMSIGWIVLGSFYSAFYSNPSFVDNHLDAVKLTQSFWIQAMINTTFAADSFFVLSGTLYAFNFMKLKSKNKSKKMHQVLTLHEYILTVIHRLARIIPCYYFVLMVYTNLGPYMTAGSEFRNGLKSTNQCTDHWWANLLFISNFYKSDKMCMPWTYYLVNDFQFSLLSPLVVIPLLCHPLIGFCLVGLMIAVQVVSVMVLNVGINGSVMRMSNTDYFSQVYVKPYCRVAPYVIGLALGYLLYTTERKVKLRKVPLVIGWFVCIAVVATLPYVTYSENQENGYKWSDIERSLFEALSRPCWGLCVSWIIFSCCNGQGGFISKLLSWNFFIPLCRITYGVYLIHPIFIEILMTSSHYNFFVSFGEVTYGYISVMVSCWLIALFFMASVEQPFIGVESLVTSHLFKHKK